jgi:hypothetical protein
MSGSNSRPTKGEEKTMSVHDDLDRLEDDLAAVDSERPFGFTAPSPGGVGPVGGVLRALPRMDLARPREPFIHAGSRRVARSRRVRSKGVLWVPDSTRSGQELVTERPGDDTTSPRATATEE